LAAQAAEGTPNDRAPGGSPPRAARPRVIVIVAPREVGLGAPAVAPGSGVGPPTPLPVRAASPLPVQAPPPAAPRARRGGRDRPRGELEGLRRAARVRAAPRYWNSLGFAAAARATSLVILPSLRRVRIWSSMRTMPSLRPVCMIECSLK